MGETYTSDARIKFEAKAQLLNDLLRLTFSHEYGQKITEELDEVLNYDRELAFNESTRLNAAIVDLIEDLALEGQIERNADDTEGDTESQVIEVSYALKLDWRYEALSLTSAFKYTDKGEDADTAEFTAQLGWKGEQIDIAGDYQFTKTYSDLTEEGRKLNLKLSYRF
jgi:predicted porin